MVQTVTQTHETAAGLSRDAFFSELYLNVFPPVASFIRMRNGTLDDAKDIFQDALIIFYEKKMQQSLEIQLTDEAYVFGIVKHLWIKKVKGDQRVLLSETEAMITLPVEIELDHASNSIVDFLKSTGQKCMNLLQAFYYDKKSLETIKSSFGFSSIRSATVQKFKCLEKVRDLVKQKFKHYEDFIDQA